MRTARHLTFGIAALGALLASSSTSGFVFQGYFDKSRTSDLRAAVRWVVGSDMNSHLQLDAPREPLTDGSASFNEAFAYALVDWQTVLEGVRLAPTFSAAFESTADRSRGNGVNNVYFSDRHADGSRFPNGMLAITLWNAELHNDGYPILTEADVIFNSSYTWDSYEGEPKPSVIDLYRVALHEIGHMLGLDHPDHATPPQTVEAIMNSRVGITPLDRLAADDALGGQTLYSIQPPGRPVVTATASGTVITVNWSHPTTGGDPTAYLVEVGESPGATSRSQIAGTPQPTLSLGGFNPGTYYARVRGVNWAGKGEPSTDVSVTVRNAGCTLPGTPTLAILSNSNGTLVLGWTVPSGNPTGYFLYYALNRIAPGELDAPGVRRRNVGNAAAQTFRPGEFEPGRYFMRLRAENACGLGPVSAEIPVTIVAPMSEPRTFIREGTARFTVRRPHPTLGECRWTTTIPYRITLRFTVGANDAVNGTARVDGTLDSTGFHNLCRPFSDSNIGTTMTLRGTTRAMSFEGTISQAGSGNVYRLTFTGRQTGDVVTGTRTFTFGGFDGSGQSSAEIILR